MSRSMYLHGNRFSLDYYEQSKLDNNTDPKVVRSFWRGKADAIISSAQAIEFEKKW